MTPLEERPALLVVTGSPPGKTGVGQLYMHSLCALVEAPIAVVALNDRFSRAEEPDDYPTLSLTARFEPAWRASNSLLGRLQNWVGVRTRLMPHARGLLAQAADFGRDCRPHAVLAVLDTPTAVLMAAELADRLDCSLHSLVWDMPEYLLGKRGHAGLSAAPILHAFEKAMRRSASVAVMSEAMQAEFGARYGVDTVILHQPVDPSWSVAARAVHANTSASADDFVIGFAGSVTARDEMEVLFKALDRCNWMLYGRQVRVRVYGLRVVCQARTARFIEYRGYLAEVADVVAGLAGSDILFLPQPFGAEHDAFTRYSFPTKLTTYVAAARPILLLAPTHATLSRFFADNGMPLACSDDDPDAVLQLLQAFASDAGLRERAVSSANALAVGAFAEALCRERLARFLGTVPEAA